MGLLGWLGCILSFHLICGFKTQLHPLILTFEAIFQLKCHQSQGIRNSPISGARGYCNIKFMLPFVQVRKSGSMSHGDLIVIVPPS